MTPPFDFDTPIERRGTDSAKWGKYHGRDVLPMWVADMDFAAPPVVLEALRRRIDHGVFGYSHPWPGLGETVAGALLRDHGWAVEPDWIVWLPGLVSGLNVVCRSVGEPGDSVVTATPIYPPFLSAPVNMGRRVIASPMRLEGGRWTWDPDELRAAIDPRVRLLLLCNPHNPTGRVFERSELAALAEVCEQHGLVVCADEIHCDLVLDPGKRHLPFASLDDSIARRTITLMAPSKTYNVPGLGCSYAVIPDADLRRRVLAAMRGIVPEVNVLGLVACEAAYRGAAAWRDALLDYLRGNRDRVTQRLGGVPGLDCARPEATYLAWIDARATGVGDPARFLEEHGVGLSDGRAFGSPGFVRLNFGCARQTLESGLDRIRDALASR